ncbi:MAG: YceD family protein [Acutalibacteraceae bacterium]|nr:DUF177 domain-containing protein [Oscillospiraceae bacterium]
MFINLENIFNNGADEIRTDFDFDFSGADYDGVYPFATPVHLRGSIKNETDIVYLRAEASFRFDGVCDRCAASFSRDMTVPVEHILVSELNDEDNDDFILVEDMKLDIEQLVLEDIYLSLPMKILCKEDCKGICPKCGKNLNEGPCGCKKDVDPRLQALQDLLQSDT